MSHPHITRSKNTNTKELEEVAIQELKDEIVNGISPRDVGNLMLERGLLLMGEYEHLVTMRVDRKPDSEQNSYLLTCLLKRPGSLDKFRKILVDTKAAHLVERIKSKLLDLSTGFPSDTEDYWKKEYRKLEVEIQHKDEELKKLRSQVEYLKLKDDEMRRLQSQVENLTNCITSFQNNVKPFIMHPSLPENLTKTYHPDSQRSSWYTETSSSRSSWCKDSDSPRSSTCLDNIVIPAIQSKTTPSSLSIDTKLPPPSDNDDEDTAPKNNSVTPVNSVPPDAIVSPAAHSGASYMPNVPQATSNKAPRSTSRFNRKSPSKDLGMLLMRRRFKEVENNEMPGNIVALEKK